MKRLTSNSLKLIAILAMTLDHVADLLYPGFPAEPVPVLLHIIGRITAPVMWFFVAEGYYYTRNLKKYLLRMLFFAAISHFAYCFAFGISFLPFRDGVFNQTSVIWPLFWSVAALWVMHGENGLKNWLKYSLFAIILLLTFPSDWSCIPVVAVLFLYEHRENRRLQMLHILIWAAVYGAVSFFFVDKLYGVIQLGVALSFPFFLLYNGKRGRCAWMKWLFYVYYPLHLVIAGILRLLLYGNIPILF